MLFLKKFFLSTAAISGVVGATTQFDELSPFPELTRKNIKRILDSTGSWRNIVLNGTSDPEVLKTTQPNIYSLFSSNLKTFSELFSKHFYTWALFKWSDSFLENTDSSSFPNNKLEIFNELLKYKKEYYNLTNKELKPTNWLRDNYIISSAKANLENIFLDLFFNELYLKKENSNANYSFKQENAGKFKDTEYADRIAKFQEFVFNDWISNEKPKVFCKKSWKYSSKFDESLYKNDGSFKLPASPNIRFPDFSEEKTNIQEFHKKVKENNGSTPCDSSDYSIYTLDKIIENEDSYELDVLIRKFGSNENGDNNDKSSEDFSSTDKDPIEIFIESAEKENKSFKLEKNKFSGNNSKLKDKEFLRISQNVEVSSDSDKSKANHYGTYVRTKTGLSFIYHNSKHKDLKNKLLEFNKDKSTKDQFPNIDLNKELKEYFKKKGAEILARYLQNTDNSSSGGIFKGRPWDESIPNLALQTTSFLSELNKNKARWKILTNLSNTVKELVDDEWLKKDNNVNPPETAGLLMPIQLQRLLDKSSEINELELDGKDSLKNLDKSNDGSISEVSKLFSENGNKEQLHTYAKSIKDWIIKYLKTLTVRNQDNTYFLNDYILDNVYWDLTKNTELMSSTGSNMLLLNSLNFDLFNNNLNGYVDGLIKGMNIRAADNVKTFIIDSIIESFYGTYYLDESIENRINYGGYKYENGENQPEDYKFCLRKAKIRDEDDEDKKEESNGSCNKTKSNHQQWLRKLKNYWLTRNYYFNDFGYELGSEENTKYLQFLFALKWFVKDKFINFRNFASSQIPVNRFGVLLWMDKVDDVNRKVKNEESKIGNTNNDKEEIEKLGMYFRDAREDALFNPYFSRKINRPTEENKDLSLTSNSITAFARTGEKEFVEFSGFEGLITDIFNKKSLPEPVKKAIFENFKKSNPKGNKSYLKEDSNNDTATGIAFGTILSRNIVDLERLADSFHTVHAIRHFLFNYLPEESDELAEWINEQEKDDLYSNKNVSLDIVKNKLKGIFQSKNTNTKLAKAVSRFSGFLQNPEADQSIYSSKKYFIGEDASSTSGYIVYITQVNKYDFGNGFINLIRTIGFRTLMKTIMMVSMDKMAKNISNTEYLLSKKFV